ncbi:uncharacterized protein [Spinacia oleracea]|uniref:Uncharacterized protein n=1 Tax=Spinacia oleracea TaxID=3562 RepID=A0ABM3RSS6_SPIOL|nr:uncharacterized protein LOC130472195 [Spinacia oleracea]
MVGNATSSDDITRRFEAMEQRISILQKENEALHSQPRSNPSWLLPPPTQPSSAGTSVAAVATTAARVAPSQVGMTTSTMMSAPASNPVSRPLLPPMVPMLPKGRPLHTTSGAAVHSPPTSQHIPAKHLLPTPPSRPPRNIQSPRPSAQQHM